MRAVNMECFTVLVDEVEGRIDPFYYKPEFVRLVKAIKESKFGFLRFEEIIQDISGGATPRIEGDFYSDSGIPFLRVQNVTEEGINLEDVKFIKKEVHEKMLKRSQLHENELVFTITGRIGSVTVVPKRFEGNINQHSVRIKLQEIYKNNQILPEYIALFFNLKIGQKLSFRKTTGGTRPALDYEAIKDLVIPIPNLQKQEELLEKTKNAYSLKKSKEVEAQKLLDSLNDYVLNELGIKLPELKDKMCFIAFSKEVEGHRIDPKKYTERPKAILKAIQESKYKNEELRSIISESIAGEWGADPFNEVSNSSDYILCKVIRNTNFANKTNLDLTDIPERLINQSKLNNILLKAGDLLIEKSGGSPIQPVGRIALISQIGDGYTFSNFLQCIRVNKSICLPEYLFCFLKAIYSLNYMEYIQNQTTGIKNLIMEEFLLIPVCLPPIAVQNKIAEEVKNRMQKAEQLQKEAKDELEKAKQEVEKIILGDE
jgi:restriction endonuclease S subunit